MPGHEDLIRALAGMLLYIIVLAAPIIWYYLYLCWRAQREQERHNRAIEAAIARLGDCPEGCDGDIGPIGGRS